MYRKFSKGLRLDFKIGFFNVWTHLIFTRNISAFGCRVCISVLLSLSLTLFDLIYLSIFVSYHSPALCVFIRGTYYSASKRPNHGNWNEKKKKKDSQMYEHAVWRWFHGFANSPLSCQYLSLEFFFRVGYCVHFILYKRIRNFLILFLSFSY